MLLFGTLGLLGAWRQWRTDRRGALAMTALILTVTAVLIFYLNFKYGFSIRPGESLSREVRERDYFFMASFLLWGVWVAIGLAVLLEGAAELLERRLATPARWYAAAPVLALALVPFFGNRLTASRAHETVARDFAVDLLQSVEPHAILITAGDNDTFPLWYAQEVEGVRQDVLLANQSLMNTDWHLRQLQRRPVFPFDSAHAVAPWKDRSWPAPPKDRPFRLSEEEIEALPPYAQVSERSVLTVGNLTASIEPGVLDRSDIATLQLIKDNMGKRPIYFSRTTGNYADRLGLTNNLLGHGFARKLTEKTLQPSDTTASVPGMGWIDIPRTRQLLFEVYHPESAARSRPRGWVDTPSEGILSTYGLLYISFAEMMKGQRAQPKAKGADSAGATLAERAESYASRILKNTSLSRGAGGGGGQ